MQEPGLLSVLPPFIAIILAIWSRQVYLSLMAGIFSAYLILEGGDVFYAIIVSVEAVVNVFADAGNTRTIIFCALVGGLLASIHHNGGVDGFVRYMQKHIGDKEGKISHRGLEMSSYLTGFLLFIETSISALTVGAVFKPLYDKNGLSRERLALIADTSSAPSSILIPINAWGAFLLSLLAVNGLETPFLYLTGAMKYNFYPIVLIPMMLFFIWTRRSVGSIRNYSPREMEPEDVNLSKEKSANLPIYLLMPILVMVFSLPCFLIMDGWDSSMVGTKMELLLFALGNASGSKAVLLAVVSALLVSALLSRFRHGKWRNGFTSTAINGTVELMPLAMLMVLAFAIGQACKDLQTGVYLASIVETWIPMGLLPAVIFIISCVVAFSTGTSWGTFSIMLAITIPIALQTGIPASLVIAAVLSGGVFGDHCSPISDTTIISSLASGTDHIAHVRTQMPYALIAGGISFLLFLITGLLVV
jgi:tetracycline resistance efflux pump